MNNNDITRVNDSDAIYYDHNYNVFLWTGCGYRLYGFNVYANYIEQALEIIVAYCEREGLQEFLIEIDYDNFDADMSDDSIIYIDATEEGATKPYFIYSENLRVEEVEGV